MATFKVPQTLPQDLLLISEFVDVPDKSEKLRHVTEEDSDDIASSDSDEESEEEIEKVLTALPENEEDDDRRPLYVPLQTPHVMLIDSPPSPKDFRF